MDREIKIKKLQYELGSYRQKVKLFRIHDVTRDLDITSQTVYNFEKGLSINFSCLVYYMVRIMYTCKEYDYDEFEKLYKLFMDVIDTYKKYIP